jgi:regulator of replication initiation timing
MQPPCGVPFHLFFLFIARFFVFCLLSLSPRQAHRLLELAEKVSCVILIYTDKLKAKGLICGGRASYGVVRVQKFKAGDVKGIEIHDRREKNISHTNPDIDFAKSNQNYDLHHAQNKNFRQAANERISQLNLPRAVRKDAVVMAQVLVTSDRSFFDELNEATQPIPILISDTDTDFFSKLNRDRQAEFFEDSYRFLSDRYGKENVVSATVHLDEKTPHMHFNFVPATPDGRLCAKDVLTKKSLIEQQTAFFEQVGKKYGLLRGEPKESGKRRTHFNTAEFKQYASKIEASRLEAQEGSQKAFKVAGMVNDLEHRKNDLQGELGALQDEIGVSHNELDVLRNELWALDSQKCESKAERDALQWQASQAKLYNNDVAEKYGYVPIATVEHVKAESNALQSENAALKTENSALKKFLQDTMGKIKAHAPELHRSLMEPLLKKSQRHKEGTNQHNPPISSHKHEDR